MPAFFEYAAVFAAGGCAYSLLEIIFRGYTHWTMVLTGGICVVLIYLISTKSREAVWKKWIMGGAAITTVEFVVGGTVNILLGWNVWDYSEQLLNLMGQICLPFSALWVLLCVPAMWMCRGVHGAIHGKNRGEKDV